METDEDYFGKGVREIHIKESSGNYRVIYLANLEDAVYVLHAFRKKTQMRRKTDIDLARKRLVVAMTERFKSVFDVITETPQEALNMKLRAGLIREIRSKVEVAGWTQVETAKRLGITQPRVSDLLSGKLSKFSLDALVNILAAMGSEVKLEVA